MNSTKNEAQEIGVRFPAPISRADTQSARGRDAEQSSPRYGAVTSIHSGPRGGLGRRVLYLSENAAAV